MGRGFRGEGGGGVSVVRVGRGFGGDGGERVWR